ncbi:MAG: HD domain-containing protein, partial [Armatimonadetes bacterium]|nr:HD domain-containing protein [Armatimonadota bacterium]
RAVIQSHVTKGEELLRNLSSVHKDILLTVRHHHEREDGGGYPDGLKGEQIPIGARIVAVCDAVDAMLSDRPYRKALLVADVLQQLRDHSGRQFAVPVVDALLRSDIVSEYADVMGLPRGAGHRKRVAEGVESPSRVGERSLRRYALRRVPHPTQ